MGHGEDEEKQAHNALLEQKLVERIAELPEQWRKRAAQAERSATNAGGYRVSESLVRCADELERTVNNCPHPYTIQVRSSQGQTGEVIVRWCQTCGVAHIYDGDTGITAWRMPTSS